VIKTKAEIEKKKTEFFWFSILCKNLKKANLNIITFITFIYLALTDYNFIYSSEL